MKTRPHVTDREISASMDFDALLKQKDILLKRQGNYHRWRNLSLTIAAICLLVALTVLISQRQAAHTNPATQAQEASAPHASTIIDSAQSRDTGHEAIADAPAKHLKKDRESAGELETKPPASSAQIDSIDTAPSGYIQPTPVHGYPALYAYFDKALEYPPVALKDSVEGIVTVAFVIDVNGRATKVKVENSLGDAFDAEVRRLVLHMPPWRPATFNGNPVESKVSLPITFSLRRNKNP